MPKTLSGAKPLLKQSIENILKKAAYEAQITAISNGDCDPILKSQLEDDIKKNARKWADTFAKEACGPMSDAIYDFIKEIGIIATPISLVSPVGPVTGVINMTDFKII